jgi:hypothetical protein
LKATVEALKQESAGNTQAVAGLCALQKRLLGAYKQLVQDLQASGSGQGPSKSSSQATVTELQKESDLLTEAVLLNC